MSYYNLANFQASLGLKDSKKFEEIKFSCKELVNLHFDNKLSWGNQPVQAWEAFLDALQNEYPSLLERPIKRAICSQIRFYAMTKFNGKIRVNARKDSEARLTTPRRSQRLMSNGQGPYGRRATVVTPVRDAIVKEMAVKGMAVKDTAVKTFLANCRPPMSNLLPTFRQLGFDDGRCLDGAALWPRYQLFVAVEKWKFAGMFNDLQTETLRVAFDERRARLTYAETEED